MKAGNWIFAGVLVLLGNVLVMPAVAQNDSATVRAAKQKASEKKAGHVYTDEDFPGTQAPADTTASSQGNDTSATTAGDAKPDNSGDKSDAKAGEKNTDGKSADSAKAADDEKLKDLQAKLADAKKGEQELQRKLVSLQEKADGEKEEFRRNMYLDMISNQQVTLSEFRREQENLQSQINREKDKVKPAENKPSE